MEPIESAAGMMGPVEIEIDDPTRADVTAFLTEHLTDMYATSPAESVHALDVEALTVPSITFWTAREDGLLLGCGALRELDPTHGEIKSMRTTAAARGRGVADAVLAEMTRTAIERGYRRLSLETGVEDYFAAARRLYARNGFVDCEPFGAYRPDRHSVFLTKEL